MTPVPLISVSGTPGELGAAYGAAAQDRIRSNVEVYLRRFAAQSSLDDATVRRAGARMRDATVTHHPRIAQTLDGVAEGASVAVEHIYALNGRTELLVRAGPPDGADGGCTSAGVLGSHTASGHLLVGQNWDWHPDQRDAMVLLRSTDERGHTVLALTEAGMLAKVGLNSAGLGVCVNLIGCDRDGLPADRPAGVPYHVLVRAVLESDSLGWALRATFRSPRSASINLLLGQAAEAGGELLDLELVPGDVGWLSPVDGVLTHANHLESGLPVFDTVKNWGGSSPFRSARARRLLAGPAADRKLTEDDLAAVFRDHAGAPMAICRHADERDSPIDRSETIYSILMDLDDRRLGLAPGPSCGSGYTWHDLL